jgi:hypothetical protein
MPAAIMSSMDRASQLSLQAGIPCRPDAGSVSSMSPE